MIDKQFLCRWCSFFKASNPSCHRFISIHPLHGLFDSTTPHHLVLQADRRYLAVGWCTHGSRLLVQCMSSSSCIVMQYIASHLLRLQKLQNTRHLGNTGILFRSYFSPAGNGANGRQRPTIFTTRSVPRARARLRMKCTDDVFRFQSRYVFNIYDITYITTPRPSCKTRLARSRSPIIENRSGPQHEPCVVA